MASTNKTTHYELSQYIGTDKPTYLGDYNTDMSNIDTGIYNAQADATSALQASSSASDVANSAIGAVGTLSNLTTTIKSDLVSAVNEVDAHEKTDANNIGTLSSLTTSAKTNLVSAVNEVNTVATGNNVNIGSLANLTTTNKSNVVSAINEVDANNKELVDYLNLSTNITVDNSSIIATGCTLDSANSVIKIATNSDKTLGKVYGNIHITNVSTNSPTLLLPSGLFNVDSQFNIAPIGLSNDEAKVSSPINATFNTNGSVLLTFAYVSNTGGTLQDGAYGYLLPCLYFIKDFGD